MSAQNIADNAAPINVAETLAEIRRRVAARLAGTVPEIPELAVPPLEPLRQARIAAEGWSGSIGVVNPRRPGPHNTLIQAAKKLMARSLRWFGFPQRQFNAAVVTALVRTEELLADVNRNLVVVGQNLADRQRSENELAGRLAALEQSVERSLEQISASARDALQEVRSDLSRVQQGYWKDFEKLRSEFERLRIELSAMVEGELTVVRQRLRGLTGSPSGAGIPACPPEAGKSGVPAAPVPLSGSAVGWKNAGPTSLDYFHFEMRFRGAEEEVRGRFKFYLPILEGHAPALDLACGRGEMLELLRERGVDARGVDLDREMVERCRDKGLAVERSDAIAYLEAQPDGSLGAVFSAQFIEHLDAAVYSRLIELAYAKLRSGGVLVLETQNPECLAIYSQSFFLDPTHVRPVPAAQLHYLLAEQGFTDVRTHYLSPVSERLPELPLWEKAAGGEEGVVRLYNGANAQLIKALLPPGVEMPKK